MENKELKDMTDKEINKMLEDKTQIILQHTRLAKEYSELCNSDNLLTSQEWEKINLRKTEILLEIDRLRAIESTWSEFKDTSIDERRLKMITKKEVADMLNVSLNQVAMYCEIGMLKPIKTGKNYMFMPEDIYEFQKAYLGKDISNREKALLSYNEVMNQ